MKNSTFKANFTKSANGLMKRATDLAINDDNVEEQVIKHYQTIANQLKQMSAMSDKAVSYASSLEFDFKAIDSLTAAQSREFYKRLRAVCSAAVSEKMSDNPLLAFIASAKAEGKRDSYKYSELRKMFRHSTNTQAGYFARAFSMIGAGSIDNTERGNNQNNYKFIPDWNSKVMQDLIG